MITEKIGNHLLKKKKYNKVLFTFQRNPVSDFIKISHGYRTYPNENKLKKQYQLISSNCDVVAIAPYLKLLDKHFKIIFYGHITKVICFKLPKFTLKFKSNLSSPGNIYSHYALGICNK